MYRGELSLRVIACTFVIQFVRLSHVSLVKHIRAGKRVLLRKLVVHLGRKIVLRRYRLPCKCEYSRIARPKERPIRQRIESVQEGLNRCVRRNSPSRKVSRARCCGRDCRYLRQPLCLTQPLVVTEDEGVPLPYRAARRCSKFISMKSWLHIIEEIPLIEGAVANLLQSSPV